MNIKPLANLTRPLVVLLIINIGWLIIAVLVDIYAGYEYSMLSPELKVGEMLLPSEVTGIVVGIAQILLAIGLGVTFLRWIYRANKNLHALSSRRMTFTPGWSIGWYFVPIANVFKPYQAMKEIWIVAHGGARVDQSILGWWWLLWIVSTVLGRVAMRLSWQAEYAQDYAISAAVYGASDGLDVILNIVALMLVLRIAKAYGENYVETGATLGGGSVAEPSSSKIVMEPPAVN